MTDPTAAIEGALLRLEAAVAGDPRWSEDYPRERARFSAAIDADGSGGASWRFREYFLLERRDARLGVPPAAHLWETVIGDDAASGELAETVLGSFTGIFEVAEAASECLTLVDLVQARELDVLRSPSLEGVREEDLVVGRAYPARDGRWMLSPGTRTLRDLPVVEALRRDVERLRAERPEETRHAHFSQRDLEKVLFQPTEVRRSASEILAEVTDLLALADLPDDTLDALAAAARADEPSGSVMGPILERLAFDTRCDLHRAQIVLWEFWEVARAGSTSRSHPPAIEARPTPTPTRGTTRADRDRTRAAVEAFESGRAAGQDLDALFRQLESDLGLEGEDDALDESPDDEEILGVSSILAEYRWDTERVGERLPGRAYELVDRFARFIDGSALRPASVEDLGEVHLQAFVVRDLLACQTGPEDRMPWEALAHFLAWCDREQSSDVGEAWAQLETLHAERFRRLRGLWNAQSREARGRATQLEWLRLDRRADAAGRFEAERILGRRGDEITVRPGDGLAGRLEPGDLILCELGEGGTILVVHEAYPREAEPLLRSDSWGVDAQPENGSGM